MPLVKCPTCHKETEYQGNEFRPFCSERCQLIDFGAWADGDFGFPTENAELTESDIEEIEKAFQREQKL
jgi:uncharacterized protein